MVIRIMGSIITAAAIVAATVGFLYVTAGVGMPTPAQSAAWSFLHELRADGVEVHRVTCGEGVATPSEQAAHLLEVRGEGGNTACRVHLPGRTVTVTLHVFEDGSYRFADPDDRP